MTDTRRPAPGQAALPAERKVAAKAPWVPPTLENLPITETATSPLTGSDGGFLGSTLS
jgi:hypothetical protein